MTFDDLPPSATRRPREKLLEFLYGHDRWLCELVDLGQWGVEAQCFKNEEFNRSRRFDRSERCDSGTRADQWGARIATQADRAHNASAAIPTPAR